MRWLQRTAHNVTRVLHYREIADHSEPPKPLAERLQTDDDGASREDAPTP